MLDLMLYKREGNLHRQSQLDHISYTVVIQRNSSFSNTLYNHLYCSVHYDRKSFEFEDLAESTSSLFSRSLSQDHHYEDILGQTPLLLFTDFSF